MGGKHKQAQRTKNNARPSSSGRSAELLINTKSQFSGLSTVKEAGFVLPSFSIVNIEEDVCIDSNFQLIFKKMGKKDSTTKSKALQEFAELVRNSEPDAVKAVLPCWPRLYSSLATDAEHRVRENAHIAHNEVVVKIKRNIAPHLKQLIAPWFISQYDNYPPAASAARMAFNSAFPENKVEEAIVFCQKEILLYICDNLTVQTAQTLSSMKPISPEDSEAKYERILISSLLGYAFYLRKVPTAQIENSAELNEKIVSNAKFWKYSTHKNMLIRSAWFEVIGALCQKALFLVRNEGSRIVPTVIGNLDETEPAVLPAVWQAALVMLTTIDKWWTFINVEKLMLPKLFKVLRAAGQGNASVIFPNLLPFLSNISSVIDLNTFYSSFFESLCCGLKLKSVLAIKSESIAVSTALIECLQYVILINVSNVPLCEKLIKSYLISILEWCLLERQACYKMVFNKTSSLVQYWSRNQNEKDLTNYGKYFAFFWKFFETLLEGVLYNLQQNYDKEILNIVLTRQIELLQSLRHTIKPKKNLKVKFTSESEGLDLNYDDNNEVHSDTKYAEALNNLVYNLCQFYVKFIEEKKSPDVLKSLHSLVHYFDSREFFEHLGTRLKKDNEKGRLMLVFDNLFIKWLEASALRTESLVHLIFVLCKYLGDNEKQMVLNEFTRFEDEVFTSKYVKEALSHPHNKDRIIQEWLKTDHITQFLVNIVEQEIADKCLPELGALLALAITENENGEILISEEAISQIIQKLNKVLLNPEDHLLTVDSCASLSCYLSTVTYTDTLLLSYGDDLLLALFSLSLKSHEVDPECLSKDTLWEVQTTCQDAISTLMRSLNADDVNTLMNKITRMIDVYYMERPSSSFEGNKFYQVIVGLLRATLQSVPTKFNDILTKFIDREFTREWRDAITNMCKAGEYVRGNLGSKTQTFSLSQGLSDDKVLKYFMWSHVRLSVITSSLDDSERYEIEDDFYDDDEEEEEEEEKEIEEGVERIVHVIGSAEKVLCEVLYDLVLLDSYVTNYKTSKTWIETAKYKTRLTEQCRLALGGLEEDVKDLFKKELKEKVVGEGWFWCKVVYVTYKEYWPSCLLDIYREFTVGLKESSLPYLHMIQIFSDYLPFEDNTNIGPSAAVMKKLVENEMKDRVLELFQVMENIRQQNMDAFYCRDSSSVNWEVLQITLECIGMCTALANSKCDDSLERKYYDFCVLSLSSWTSNLLAHKQLFDKVEIQALLVGVSKLYLAVNGKIQELKNNLPNSEYIAEWEDLFEESIQLEFVKTWLHFAEKFHSRAYTANLFIPLLQILTDVMDTIKCEYIFRPSSKLPKWTSFVHLSCSLLMSNELTLQLWAYKMLLRLVPGFVEIDSVAVNTNTPHEKGLIIEHFKDILFYSNEIVNSMLLGFKLGEDSCRVEPYTDSFSFSFAYLLIWEVVLTLCERSPTELRFQYADWLRNEDLLKGLFSNLFRLMPVEVLHHYDGKKLHHPEWFTAKPVLSGTDATSEKLEHMVCWIYASTLSQLPALVRQWWSGTDSRIAHIVERITAAYVTPQLCSEELIDVAVRENKFKNMTVRVIPTIKEVVAVYTVDDAQMELVITLPNNYPLVGPDVHCNRQICGTSHKQWLMQMKKCVLHQNGRIWDGLAIWNNNLDKKFDGVEECYICFAVLHPGTYQLPKLSCQTCKKKFHSACLYKWFSTSNKSSCPICRNLF